MANYAAKSLAKEFNKLFESRDNDGDFSVKLKDTSTKPVKIHSWVLNLHSEVLGKMTTADFKEKTEKLIEFPKYSDYAVEAFIKFLYGFELELHLTKNDDDDDENVNYETAFELIEMGGVYGVREVQLAAADLTKKYLTKENVFETMQICKENDLDVAVDFCAKFATMNFSKKEILESGVIMKLPEIACKFLENDVSSPFVEPSSVKVPDHVKILNLSEKSTVEKISFLVDKKITIKGIGLMLSQGADVEVEVELYEGSKEYYHGSNSLRVVRKSEVRCHPIMFTKIFTFPEETEINIKISLRGSGAVFSALSEFESDSGSEAQAMEKYVQGYDALGNYAGHDVKFKFKGKSLRGMITDVFFYVD